MDRMVAEARRSWEQREQSYRAKALKIHPWICARCGREFSGKRLRELTVHHKDHNHDNNPEDGSNWELLCLYCHGIQGKYTQQLQIPLQRLTFCLFLQLAHRVDQRRGNPGVCDGSRDRALPGRE